MPTQTTDLFLLEGRLQKPSDLTRDDILDNITLYWLTNTGVSSARLSWENKGGFFTAKGVTIPVGVSTFADELYRVPRSWAEQAYPNLVYYNQDDRGGHFAAWEQPQLLSEDVRATFRSLRWVDRVHPCAHALARRGDRVARLRATRPRRAARPRRRRGLLDTDLHQLATHRAVHRAWSQAYRNDRLVVSASTRPSSRPSTRSAASGRRPRSEDRLPVAGRQRLRNLERLRHHYWPALYFVDTDGISGDHHVGEGRYEQSERAIQRLLGRARAPLRRRARRTDRRARLPPLKERPMDQEASEWTRFLRRANQLFRATMHPAAVQLPVEGRMPSLDSAIGWLNSRPLTAAGLRGRVVLVNFWTYTCINWLRTLPYLRAWSDKYQDQGLVVIGVHTPEFDVEHDLDNVRRAVKDLRVTYPIAVDSDYGIWNAFGNRYWPAFYFVDAQGQIRHHRFGEGEYEQSEMILQQLLTEAGSGGIDQDLVSVDPSGVEAAADWASLWSPENYLGYERTENFASSNGAVLDTPHTYAAPTRLRLNHWALAGAWTVKRQAIVLNEAEGRIVYRFHARDLHLVMGPAAPGTPVRFRVRLDGQPPGAAHGTDVDDQGNGTVTEPRLYQLIRQPGPVSERTFEITFLDPGVHAYAFTFG